MKLRRPAGLWLHRDFRSLWAAETISVFGTGISQLALPLVAVITLEASAFEVALLGVVEFLPFILISLPAGVWVDRMRRKPILVTADIGRALHLSTATVKTHLQHIYEKLGVSERAAAVAEAMRRGLLE